MGIKISVALAKDYGCLGQIPASPSVTIQLNIGQTMYTTVCGVNVICDVDMTIDLDLAIYT